MTHMQLSRTEVVPDAWKDLGDAVSVIVFPDLASAQALGGARR